MSESELIGFVGLGMMGHGIAKNIVEAGYPLSVVAHRSREAVDDLVGRGATEVDSLAALAQASDTILFCLPGSPQVEAAIGEILDAGCREKILIDCSTCDPVSTRALAARISESGGALVDAPLSKTPKEAWAGELTVMAGADAAVFERVTPLLSTFTGKCVRVGETGAGHTMKLLNNFISLGYATLYSEALAIGERNGVDAATFHSVLDGGRMDCGFYQTFMQYVVKGDRDAHRFALSMAHKDMKYLVSLADQTGIATQVAAPVKNYYALAQAMGRGDDYVPMMRDVVATLNGLDDDEAG